MDYKELASYLYEAFSNHIDTADELLLHEERYIIKTLKNKYGKKLYEQMDELNQVEWNYAWSLVNGKVKVKYK